MAAAAGQTVVSVECRYVIPALQCSCMSRYFKI